MKPEPLRECLAAAALPLFQATPLILARLLPPLPPPPGSLHSVSDELGRLPPLLCRAIWVLRISGPQNLDREVRRANQGS